MPVRSEPMVASRWHPWLTVWLMISAAISGAAAPGAAGPGCRLQLPRCRRTVRARRPYGRLSVRGSSEESARLLRQQCGVVSLFG